MPNDSLDYQQTSLKEDDLLEGDALEPSCPIEFLSFIKALELDNLYSGNRFDHSYSLFCTIIESGDLNTLKHIAQRVPSEIKQMIEADNYRACLLAAVNGHLDILKYFIELMPANHVNRMIMEFLYGNHYRSYDKPNGLSVMAKAGYRLIVDYLLRFPAVFAYAEKHLTEYEQYIEPFMADWLQRIRTRDRLEYPGIVYSREEAELCFYMLKYLIRTSDAPTDPYVAEHVEFLSEIPVLNDMISRQIPIHGTENELLRLAKESNKPDWVYFLASLDPFASLAANKDFYQEKASVQMHEKDRTVKSQDSSLHGLNASEQSIAVTLNELYPVNDKEEQWAKMLKEILSCYQDKPASVELIRENQKSVILLPADYGEFRKLCLDKDFSDLTIIMAKEAYYRHPIHTVLRFLMKPNPWIDQDWGYESIDVGNGQSGYCTGWVGLESLIIQTWTAATDERCPGCDGYSIESRRNEYFSSIRLLARSGNQYVIHQKGKKLKRDDLRQDDYPTDPIDIRNGFINAVKGHPILSGNIEVYVSAYVYDAVRQLMATKLNKLSTQELEVLSLSIIELQESPASCEQFLQYTNKLNVTAQELSAWEGALKCPAKTAELFNNKIAAFRSVDGNHFIAGLGQYDLRPLLQKIYSERKDGCNQYLKTTASLEVLQQPHSLSKRPLGIHLLYQEGSEILKGRGIDFVKICSQFIGALDDEEQEKLLYFLFSNQFEFFEQLRQHEEKSQALSEHMEAVQKNYGNIQENRTNSDHDTFRRLCAPIESHLLTFLRDNDGSDLRYAGLFKSNTQYNSAQIKALIIERLDKVNRVLTVEHQPFIEQLRRKGFLEYDDVRYIQFERTVSGDKESLYDALPSNPVCDDKQLFLERNSAELKRNLFAEMKKNKLSPIIKKLVDNHQRLINSYPEDPIVQTSECLISKLKKAQEQTEPEAFKMACNAAIENARERFATHRGNPILVFFQSIVYQIAALFNGVNEDELQRNRSSFFNVPARTYLPKSAEVLHDVSVAVTNLSLSPLN